jgi:hypothetical protein
MVDLGSDVAVAEPPADSAEEVRVPVLCTAELAECTCPEFCERDHDTD